MAQLLINEQKKFMFIHIHKNGGNSVGKFIKDRLPKTKEYPTLSAFKAKLKYPKQFDDFYVFSIVRNPWSRFVSWYMFLRQWEKVPSRIKKGHWSYIDGDPNEMEFSDWLVNSKFMHNQFPKQKNVPVQLISQFDWVTNRSGKVIVDFIADLSNINRDWGTICKHIGLSYEPLTKENTTKHEEYREYYDDVAINHVRNVAKREIEYFKYEF